MPTPLQTIFAGEQVTVKMHDGSMLVVRVRQMPMRRLLSDVLPVLHDGGRLIETCCDSLPGASPLPENWIDNLKDESFSDLWEKARELNFFRAVKLAEETAKVAEQLLPLNETTKHLRVL